MRSNQENIHHNYEKLTISTSRRQRLEGMELITDRGREYISETQARHVVSHDESDTELMEPPPLKPLPIDSPHRRPSNALTEKLHRVQKSPIHQKKLEQFIANRRTRYAPNSTSPQNSTIHEVNPSTPTLTKGEIQSSPSLIRRHHPTTELSSFSQVLPGSSSFEEFVSFDVHNATTPKKSTLHSFGANSPYTSSTTPTRKVMLPDEYSFHVEDVEEAALHDDSRTKNSMVPTIIREKQIFDQESSNTLKGHPSTNIPTSDIITPNPIVTKTWSKTWSDAPSLPSMRRPADDDSVSQATFIHYGQVPSSRHQSTHGLTYSQHTHIETDNDDDDDDEDNTLLSFADNAAIMAQKISDTETYKSAQDDLKEGAAELANMTMRDPSMPMALGICSAALLGAFILGPVGVVVGTAAVGIAAGYMQIPEAQRTHAMKKMTDVLDTSCQSVCGIDTTPCIQHLEGGNLVERETPVGSSPPVLAESLSLSPPSSSRLIHSGGNDKIFERSIMVLRNSKGIPLGQIHSLDPVKQPRAWLEVLASASSSIDDKTEAMEEILIWTKDKTQARRLLEDGILDSLLFIIRNTSEEYSDGFRSSSRSPTSSQQNPSLNHGVLAANCCIALAKAHSAAVLANGDVGLGNMSISRQCAIMFTEVRHFIAVQTDDGLDPGYMFKVSNLTSQEAEDLGRTVTMMSQWGD